MSASPPRRATADARHWIERAGATPEREPAPPPAEEVHLDDASPRSDDRMSFFSAHASITATTTMYLGLYLHRHVFATSRDGDTTAWWELPVYARLAGLAIYVPYTRVVDHSTISPTSS